jgi:hypothetical protein
MILNEAFYDTLDTPRNPAEKKLTKLTRTFKFESRKKIQFISNFNLMNIPRLMLAILNPKSFLILISFPAQAKFNLKPRKKIFLIQIPSKLKNFSHNYRQLKLNNFFKIQQIFPMKFNKKGINLIVQ